MSEPTQGAVTATRLALLRRTAIVAVAAALAHGCVGGKSDSSALDAVLTTATVPAEATDARDEGLVGDGQAILSALSSGAPAAETALPWENPESGARGLITAYSGEERDGRDCLDFTTTRENFDGIGLYKGTACEDAAGILRMRELTSL